MSKRDAKLYIEDIMEALEKIERYTNGLSFEDFAASPQVIDAVVRNFEIIGEAVNNIPNEVAAAHPDIPWEKMVSMRNKVIHEYFGIDEEIVWKTIHEDLPVFQERIVKMLKEA